MFFFVSQGALRVTSRKIVKAFTTYNSRLNKTNIIKVSPFTRSMVLSSQHESAYLQRFRWTFELLMDLTTSTHLDEFRGSRFKKRFLYYYSAKSLMK